MGLFSRTFSKSYRRVSVVEARALPDDGAALVDVRTNREWNADHTRAARDLALGTLEEAI